MVIARDGEEALKRVKEDSPDLIILDVMMPKLDGYKVCRLLKFDRRFKSTPVLMLTARTQAEDISLATQCGADAYMSKPFQSKEFVDKISELLAAAESSESFQAPIITDG